MRNLQKSFLGATALAVGIGIPAASLAQDQPASSITPSSMSRVGQVDERYQSFNVEMLELTGGRFWKPYSSISKGGTKASASASSGQQAGDAPAGMDPNLYEYRPPIDLTNPRLRALAKALGPAYVRYSGTWENTTFFAHGDNAPKNAPTGYAAVLTEKQWQGAIDFANAVDAQIVTSMPIGTGTRDASGVWQPDQARIWLAYTKAHGGTVAAAEYFNEPTLASMGGAPKGYDAADFGKDFAVYHDFMRKEFPDVKLLGPGSVGEADAPWAVASGGYANMKVLTGPALAATTKDADFFSYHHYGAVSQRCVGTGHQTSADQALTEDWLGRTDVTLAFYRAARDQSMPGKSFWLTETADAACGGNPWGGTFLDTFRYLDQLGRLAKQDVKVVIHNTLDASDYGLLDEKTYTPKPNYWAALLWKRNMGTTVLDAGLTNGPGMHVYAQCLKNSPGGVAVLILDTDKQQSRTLTMPAASQRYTLTAANLTDKTVLLNGTPLKLGANDAVPGMAGQPTEAGPLTFAPASITFLAIPSAQNQACQ